MLPRGRNDKGHADRVLALLNEQQHAMSAREIAETIAIPVTSVRSVILRLKREGYIAFSSRNGPEVRYRCSKAPPSEPIPAHVPPSAWLAPSTLIGEPS